MSESQEDISANFITYVESLLSEGAPGMLTQRVIPNFLLSIRKHDIRDFSANTIETWIADMLLDGLKVSTARRYVGALRQEYSSWNPSSLEDLFPSTILDNYRIENSAELLAKTDANLSLTKNLINLSFSPSSPLYVSHKIFLYLLYNPNVSLSEVIDLKFSDAEDSNPHTEDIVISMRKAKQAKYVFPLLQGKSRPAAIQKKLISDLYELSRRAKMDFKGAFSRYSLTTLWIAAAIKAGIPLTEIAATITNLPPLYSFLESLPKVILTDERKQDIIIQVAESLSNKTPGWFVAKLRGRITPDDITERLKEIKSPLLSQLQFFYPLKTVPKLGRKKTEKNKLKSVQVPILPGILFFRLPYDRVTQLMANIGDLAWCYKNSNRPDSSYSVISKSEMKTFQQTVGAFTDDIEMELISALPEFAVGDEVKIEDGSMLSGKKATIRKVKNTDGTLTYYLRLSDSAFIRWNDIKYEAMHLQKIE